VLAPNTELAAVITDAVERLHCDSGHELWPTPKVREFSSWLRERHAHGYLESNSPRCLVELEERELWRSVVLESSQGLDLLEPQGAARAAQRAYRALYEYAIPLPAVAEYATDESQCLLQWIMAFERRCSALGCMTVAQLLGEEPHKITAIAWIESPQWRPVARRWLQAHAQQILTPQASPASKIRNLHASSVAVEFAAVADWARLNLLEQKDFRAWICIPDLNTCRSDVVDAFDAALVPQRYALGAEIGTIPYALAGGTPLAEYASVRCALDALIASFDRVPFERFSALLLAAEFQESTLNRSSATRLDLKLRRRAPSEATLKGWLEISQRLVQIEKLRPVGALARLENLWNSLNELQGAQLLSRWIPVWGKAFEAGPWALRARWSSIEYQAAERLRDLMNSLAASDQLLGTHTFKSAAQLLIRAARDTAFQPQTGVPAVWITQQTHDPWLNYDGLWVTGRDERRWPAAVDPIALIPVALQKRYGVVAADAQAQMRAALDLQKRWALRAVESVFSFSDSSDNSNRPSRLLTTEPVRVEAITQPHWHFARRNLVEYERLVDDRGPAFTAHERTQGVATLKAQSRCAFRGFAETRLGTEAIDKPVPGFNDRERGDLIHYALQLLWAGLHDYAALCALTVEAQAELIEASITRALQQQCLKRDPGIRWQKREAVRMAAVLHKWLAVEVKREPFKVERLEYASQWVTAAGPKFEVRIDRIDQLLVGGRVLIDYKSGMASADWRGDRPDNPQLPLYALLQPQELVAVAYARVNASECTFVAESERAGIFGPRSQRSALEDHADLAALVGVWSTRLEKLAQEFSAGNAMVAPTLTACQSCHLQGFCRVLGVHERDDDD